MLHRSARKAEAKRDSSKVTEFIRTGYRHAFHVYQRSWKNLPDHLNIAKWTWFQWSFSSDRTSSSNVVAPGRNRAKPRHCDHTPACQGQPDSQKARQEQSLEDCPCSLFLSFHFFQTPTVWPVFLKSAAFYLYPFYFSTVNSLRPLTRSLQLSLNTYHRSVVEGGNAVCDSGQPRVLSSVLTPESKNEWHLKVQSSSRREKNMTRK